jgi:T4-like virus Myoviridae tail sheath stabiliser
MNTYFYSGQIRRFLSQFIRVVSNFQIKVSDHHENMSSLIKVPVYYGDSSRHVASIINKNSESNLPTVPAMAVYIKSLKYDRARVQNPTLTSKVQVRQRAIDPETGNYTNLQGDIITVERLMPVPYMLSLSLDLWTSNTDQKLQLVEQIAVLFNPSLEIQNTDNYLDWTSLSVITLTDTNFSSRTVPVGPEDQIDVFTFSFDLPIWLSAPGKVKRYGIIEKIVNDIYGEPDTEGLTYFDLIGRPVDATMIFTPINLNVVYLGNTLKLFKLKDETEFTDETESNYIVGNWKLAIQSYGELAQTNVNDLLKNGLSQIRLRNDGITIVGTVSYHPSDNSLLLFNVDIDTLPVNTLTPITAIIDPWNLKLTNAITNPVLGTRFLILNSIGSILNDDGNPSTIDGPPIWNRSGEPELIAEKNSIIEWDGNKWTIDFDSLGAGSNNIEYVTNLTTGIQYKWKDQQWIKSVEGRYGVGAWSFVPN